jgi:hypothetical protein
MWRFFGQACPPDERPLHRGAAALRRKGRRAYPQGSQVESATIGFVKQGATCHAGRRGLRGAWQTPGEPGSTGALGRVTIFVALGVPVIFDGGACQARPVDGICLTGIPTIAWRRRIHALPSLPSR